MGQTVKPTRQNRTITVDFHDETTYSELLGNTKAFLEVGLRLSPRYRLPAHTPSNLSRRWSVPDAPFPLCPCPLGRSHDLAYPVHHVQNGLHGPAALRLALPSDATRGRSRCPVG